MASIFHSITDRTQGVHKSNDWYRRQVSTIASKISASKLMAEGKLLNSPSSGRLNMFFYNPKTKDVLPYYDTFPLVLPLETYNDGFLGLNLHYLPIPLRVKLLDGLVDYTNSEDFTATTTRMVVNYNKLKSIRLIRPTIHKYLSGYTKSQFRRIDADEFTIATLLPVQRFKKASDTAVWKESRSMI